MEFGLGWGALVAFILFLLGYWLGRDTNKRPFVLSESAVPILYGWAFVGLLSWLLPLGAMQ
ncbi:hypothetical protein MHO82_24615 [Vibrio sp. Of7-15]|uniref:hypothetical protein n=1 Tax=Vibrio sp. Of7-15 TaxID=2724879 RepID=UPI001EF29468|nr:hypothetical protein [Vibrio sp. Of7-15]MCG7500051.1 hypothetical protein [Vibrio sp. Of7-15]